MEENTMTSTLAKKETVARKWYVIDAAGKPLGRTAVIDTDKAVLTGKKAEQKKYYRVSGWIGGLKETKARIMMETRSDYAMQVAVKGMLPKNTLGRNCMGRLHLYKGEEHKHAAQQPVAWTQD